MWKLRRVKGRTMSPALVPGAVVIAARRAVRRGDIVLVQSKGREVLKRISVIKGSQVTIANDHGAAHRETVAKGAILGVVVFALPGAVAAPRPHKRFARIMASVCALVFIAMAATQLFAFDKFIELLDENWLSFGVSGALLGAVLVSLTVMALPYLLQMALSLGARLVSQIAGWIVAVVWLGMGLYMESTGRDYASTGHFGAFIETAPGMWTIVFGIVLLGLVALSSWMLGGTKYVQKL